MDQENDMIAELDKSIGKKGSFLRVTSVSRLNIRELGEVIGCQVSYLRRCWGKTHAMS